MTPARNAEADRAARIFQAYLARVGMSTVARSLALWRESDVSTQAGAAAWLRRAVGLTMAARAVALDLAIAYLRLVRALRTGRTVADPRRRAQPMRVTLSSLRAEFYGLIGVEAGPGPGGDERISVERVEGLEEEWSRLERNALREAVVDLDRKGPANLRRKLELVDVSQPARAVDQERDQADRQAGARQAAAAERIARNGARDIIGEIARRDRRAIGYVRVSRTGTPCGWCAMLLTRGFVRRDAFRSASTAGPTLAQLEAGQFDEGLQWHDNCQCYAEPVYSDEQMQSDLFALNREYARLWPEVTRGLSGSDALTAWRKFIREQTAAQEARQNVQEA